MNEEVIFDIKINDMDLSFVKELVDGGISDDTSSLVGDVSFSDEHNYSAKNISDNEAYEYLQSLGLETIF